MSLGTVNAREILSEDVGGPVNSMVMNKATSMVAVAGRNVFKIFNICEKRFETGYNLRIAKATTSSCNDIAWSPVDENILASANPNGAIVTWNLNKSGFSKIDTVYQDHKRPVNKIHFHSTDPWLLISGSQDRIKLFDLRQSEAVIDFSGLTESVRDLQFSPHKSNVFVSVQDNGYVQLYDIRKKDKYEQCFPGHNGPIFACDWHPELSDILATAGRDQSIKVWSLSGQTQMMQHCIQTMESVSQIRWSLDNVSHIASCSLKRDYSINIWDIHRPCIAFARFTETQEVIAGIGWRRGQDSMISVTNSGILHHLPMSAAYRPLEHTNPVGMAINPDGDIALARGNGLLRPSKSYGSNNEVVGQQPNTGLPPVVAGVSSNSPQQSSLPTRFPLHTYGGGRQSATRRSQDSGLRSARMSSRSQLDVYKCTEMNWFVKTAQEYKLSDRPLAELCDHNAEVCRKLKRFQICQTWKILKLFYASIPTSSNQITNQVSSHQQATIQGQSPNKTPLFKAGDESSLLYDSQTAYIAERELEFTKDSNQGPNHQISSEQEKMIEDASNFGRQPIIDETSMASSDHSNGSTDGWLSHDTLSYEAFQPKQDIFGRVERLMDHKFKDDSISSSSSVHEDELQVSSNNFNATSLITHNDYDIKVTQNFNSKAYRFKFYEIIADVIADVLKYHVDNSDVQSAVSILIVLGDRIKNIVNERIPQLDRESWYHSYIDLLSKFQLWNVMAQVINLSPLQNINSINQTSTSIYTCCGSCNRTLNGKVGWICDKCKTKPSECSVCHGVVVGLMSWCQGCHHGGHLIHMSQWFSENDYCPTGCGHLCEFSHWIKE